jgi:hypothetical protein
MTPITKCAHPACSCAAAEGSHHCGSSCADAGAASKVICQCQHKGCQSKSLKA